MTKSNYVLDTFPVEEREHLSETYCAALMHRCRKCDYKFKTADRENGTLQCPECSEPRGVCRKPPLTNSNRCKLHGGSSLMGSDHPQFKHGRYSKALPVRLNRLYESGLDDRDLLNLSDTIILIEAMILDELEGMDSASNSDLWRDLNKQYERFSEAMKLSRRTSDTNTGRRAAEDMQKALIKIEGIIERGNKNAVTKSTLLTLIEQRRKLTSSEVVRREKAGNTLSKQEVANLLGAISGLITTHVSDESERRAIVSGLRRLMPAGRVEL